MACFSLYGEDLTFYGFRDIFEDWAMFNVLYGCQEKNKSSLVLAISKETLTLYWCGLGLLMRVFSEGC